MNIILTKHVKERRKKGIIPEKRLLAFAQFQSNIFDFQNFPDDEKITYTVSRCGTRAIFKKTNNQLIFITFYGATGWVIDESADFSGFSISQESDYKKEKRLKKHFQKAKKPEAIYFFVYDSLKFKLSQNTFFSKGKTFSKFLLYKEDQALRKVNIPVSSNVFGDIHIVSSLKEFQKEYSNLIKDVIPIILENGEKINAYTFISPKKNFRIDLSPVDIILS